MPAKSITILIVSGCLNLVLAILQLKSPENQLGSKSAVRQTENLHTESRASRSLRSLRSEAQALDTEINQLPGFDKLRPEGWVKFPKRHVQAIRLFNRDGTLSDSTLMALGLSSEETSELKREARLINEEVISVRSTLVTKQETAFERLYTVKSSPDKIGYFADLLQDSLQRFIEPTLAEILTNSALEGYSPISGLREEKQVIIEDKGEYSVMSIKGASGTLNLNIVGPFSSDKNQSYLAPYHQILKLGTLDDPEPTKDDG